MEISFLGGLSHWMKIFFSVKQYVHLKAIKATYRALRHLVWRKDKHHADLNRLRDTKPLRFFFLIRDSRRAIKTIMQDHIRWIFSRMKIDVEIRKGENWKN